jgi:predicted TIM-barrel fold metal-dependent hydrolase
MNLDDLILVSVDDHVVEPPDVFEKHLPARYQEFAPKLKERDDGTLAWYYYEHEITNVGLNAVAGRPREEYGIEPTRLDEMRAGCWNVDERIKDMNAGGLLGSLCFPSMPGFAGRIFKSANDDDIAGAMVKAYNDWHVHEWCGRYPGRFIPLGLPMIWSAEETAKEVHRLADMGCHAITFPENPAPLDAPSLHDPYWDPFWRAAEERGTVICMHIGSSSQLAMTTPDAPVDVLITLQPMNIVQAAADLVWSRVLKEFPDIKIALSEGGIGWVPYFLDRIERTYDMHHHWTGQDLGDLTPTERFLKNVLLCFISDPVGVELVDRIGSENVSWEMDYPHSDSSWPTGPEDLTRDIAAAGLGDTDVENITHRTAMRWFDYDPFQHVPREEATVAALRKQAAGHDVTIRSMGRGRMEQAGVNIGELSKTATGR